MPYTPPSQLSPSASKSSTPKPSRSSSYINGGQSPALLSPTLEKPTLPRSNSSSYLNKHRRSPSTPTGSEIPEAMTDLQRGIGFDPHGSLRQSPPPVTNGVIPSGMTISPPDSLPNSDDEDTRGRSRELEIKNLQELQAAIRSIKGERKSGSPVRQQAERTDSSSHEHHTDSTRPPLSSQQRKISHSRSNTDSNVVFEPPKQTQALLTPTYGQQDSDTEESDSSSSRPPMVRKKSGELVRPALRASSRRRPSSMPGTPTYSKAVHFDSQLEHIRHFLQVDRPLAVSAGSSPVDNYESESEFPFGSDESTARPRTSSYEWEIRLANFPSESDERKAQPVYVERVFLSADKKHMIGTVAVQNLAFQKAVIARFTLDYWKTTSEVTAEFNNDAGRQASPDGLDRFNFSISLADQANLENKTLFFCVRYAVNGTEYWDSNSNINYQVDFTKKPKAKAPQSAPGLGARPLSALPRSRPSPPTSSGRPKSMPTSFDDFASGFDNFGASFSQSAAVIIGEPRIKLRSPRSKNELVPDAPAARRNKSSAPMFGHRYDFNSSLTAAKHNAYSILGEQSGLPVGTKQSSREVPAVAAKINPSISQKLENGVKDVTAQAVKAPIAAASDTTKPAALLSDKPPLTSQSYQELVEKYCFFGSAKSSPVMNRTLARAGDGANDDHSVSDFSVGSAESSGASTPVPGGVSPSPPSEISSVKNFSPQVSRSSSPMPYVGSCSNSRSTSPAAYRYRYHQSSSQTLLAEAPPATAIHG